MPSPSALPVILEGWVLQDGNCADFVAGTRREFALELDVARDRPLIPAAGDVLGWEPTGSAGDLLVTAEVVYVDPALEIRGCVVLDFGIRAYTNRRLPVRVGDVVTGVVSIGVDPVSYVEDIAPRWPDVPELIYRWDVERVEIDETPHLVIEPGDPRYPPYLPVGEGPSYQRDPARERWREIDRTRRWADVPNGAGLYRLTSVPTGDPPTRDLRYPRG